MIESIRHRTTRGSTTAPAGHVTFLLVAFGCLLSLRGWAAVSLLDFGVDEVGSPPEARFEFSRRPVFTQRVVQEEEGPTLVIECRDTDSVATQADYIRRFPRSHPLRRLEVLQRDSAAGPILQIRLVLRGERMPYVEAGEGSRVLRVRLDDAGGESSEANDTGATLRIVRASSPDGARAATSPDRPIFARVLGGIGKALLVLGMLALVGVLFVWGWPVIRHRFERPGPATPTDVHRLEREIQKSVARFQAAAHLRIRSATARQQQFRETVEADLSRIRNELQMLTDEFERATQSVLLFADGSGTDPIPAREDETPTVREPSPAGRDSGAEPVPQETSADAAEQAAHLRSLHAWVSQVTGRLDREPLGRTQAAPLASQMQAAPRRELLDREAASEEHPTAPTDSPNEAEETEEMLPGDTPTYSRARRMIRQGRAPIEIAGETGLSLGEIELLARLQNLSAGPTTAQTNDAE